MWSWEEWKAHIIWLADWLIALSIWAWAMVKRRPVIVGAIALVALVTALEGYRHRHGVLDFLDNGRDGRIFVNSPTVYTRQRLVNDRLDQARWLRTQLDFTEAKGRETEFQSIDAVRHTIQSTKLTASAGSAPQQTNKDATNTTLPTTQDTVKQAGPPKDNEREKQGVSVAPTTMSLFRSKSAYRDEVRSEITQTELDDRHDINGNTIFRLTFDTSIVAGTNPEAVAAVVVRLDHRPESAAKPLNEIYRTDYQDLYYSWASKFQETISNSLSSVTGSINSSAPQLQLRLNFTDFLLRRICQFMDGNLDTDIFPKDCSAGNKDKAERLLALYTRTRLSLLQWFKDREFNSAMMRYQGDEHFVIPNGDMRAAAAKACLSPENKDDQIALWQLGITKKLVAPPSTPKAGDSSGGASPPPKSADSKTTNPAPSTAENDNQGPGAAIEQISCPFSDSLKERLISGVLLYEKIFALRTDSPAERPRAPSSVKKPGAPLPQSPSSKTGPQTTPGDLLAEPVPTVAPPPSPPTAPSPFIPEAWFVKQNDADADNSYESVAQRTIGDLANCDSGACQVQPARLQCFAADFLKAKLGTYLDPFHLKKRTIQDFLTLKIVGREVNDCSIHVFPRPESNNKDFSKFLEWFRDQLNENTDAFAYSVTPKNLSENIATAAETRDAYELLLKTEANPINIASFLRSQARHQRAIINHPVVVGFGKSMPTAVAKINEIKFGWIVAGRLAEQGGYEQIDGQYPLSAYISVPGWWQTVNVSVQTCWVSRAKLTNLPAASPLDEICPDDPLQNPKPVAIPVRLPPAIPEISHKLGFDVVQQPSIFSPRQQELIIGQPGALLIEGQRLWRSTEVTAGSQRADKITVLPNMEGILAEFDCVLPPAGFREQLIGQTLDPMQIITRSNIRVWTSEGIAEPIPLVFVWPGKAPGKDLKVACDKRTAGLVQNPKQKITATSDQDRKTTTKLH